MHSFVKPSSTQIVELLLTVRASMRFLVRMALYVNGQSTWPRNSLVAVGALKRFFARVCPQMILQVAQFREKLSAVLASVVLHGLDAHAREGTRLERTNDHMSRMRTVFQNCASSCDI